MSLSYSQQHGGNRGQSHLPGPGGLLRAQQSAAPSTMHIQKILDENAGLIQTIQEFQQVGRSGESMSYQVALHRNLVYLANLADPTHNIQSLLPLFTNFNNEHNSCLNILRLDRVASRSRPLQTSF